MQTVVRSDGGKAAKRTLPQFVNPTKANNCFLGVVLHLLWTSESFVRWLLDAEAMQPNAVAGAPIRILDPDSCGFKSIQAFCWTQSGSLLS